MTTRSVLLFALLCSLACLPSLAEATVWEAPLDAFGPDDEVRLARSERIELERTACRHVPAARRALKVVYRVSSDQSLLAFVHCQGTPDGEGQIPVNSIGCIKAVAKAAWRCDHHYLYYRVAFGKRYVLANDSQMIIDVPGESPDRSGDAMAAILESDPRLNGMYCGLPRYRDGAYEIECDGVHYVVKRVCEGKRCRRTVQIQ